MSAKTMARLERARLLVLRWVRFYTRNLPVEIADARRDDLIADLHDQISEHLAAGRPPEVIARELQLRAAKGALADLQWRREQLRLAALAGHAPSGSLLVASAAGALLMVVVGLVALVRSTPLVSRQVLDVPGAFFPLAAAAAVAICGLVLLARPRTRFVGELWLVAASQLLIAPAFETLARSTTVLRLAEPELRGPLVAISIGVGLFYLAVAIAWMPVRSQRASA